MQVSVYSTPFGFDGSACSLTMQTGFGVEIILSNCPCMIHEINRPPNNE